MVVSEIRAEYSDANDLLRTVLKRIYEQWDPYRRRWILKSVEYVFDDSEQPVLSDDVEVAVESRNGWLIPPEWQFISEVWLCTRQFVDGERRGHAYDHDSEVQLLDGDAPIIRE